MRQRSGTQWRAGRGSLSSASAYRIEFSEDESSHQGGSGTPFGGASEILHPYGMVGYGGESIELEIGRAAHEAGLRMAYEERVTNASYEGFRYLCPVRSSIPNACMVGVARLRYRPHTSRTGAWMTRLLESGPGILAEFEALAADRPVA